LSDRHLSGTATLIRPRRQPTAKLPLFGPRISVKNIFVGNLNFNTSEEQLRAMFATYGTVERVSILTDRDTGRSRGFGFVEMTNEAEAEKAIAALNGANLDGRTLNVNEAKPKTDRATGGRGSFRGSRY
jgi:cold-inducible RNA-binding protein